MNNALVPAENNFPALAGNIDNDTEALVGELRVGNVVIERGWARLYLIWLSQSYLEAMHHTYKCSTCDLIVAEEKADKPCPRCGSHILNIEVEIFPTLESYVQYVAEETNKSRQTIFNRLGTYRKLCDERGVSPPQVFSLNLISSGAARKLASADEDDPAIKLVNNSWADTVDAALAFDNKGQALAFIKHDVLNEPRYTAEFSDIEGTEITIYRETYPDDEDLLVEDFKVGLKGEWPDDMIKWLSRKLNVRAG